MKKLCDTCKHSDICKWVQSMGTMVEKADAIEASVTTVWPVQLSVTCKRYEEGYLAKTNTRNTVTRSSTKKDSYLSDTTGDVKFALEDYECL